MTFTKVAQKLKMVVGSCTSTKQLQMANTYCWRLIKYGYKREAEARRQENGYQKYNVRTNCDVLKKALKIMVDKKIIELRRK